MQPFAISLTFKRKLIQIKGNIRENQMGYSNFLIAKLQKVKETLKYTGNELEQSIFFTVAFLTAQVFNLIRYSNQPAYEIGIILSIIYCATFTTFVNVNKQIIIQGLFLFIALIVLICSKFMTLFNFYAILGVCSSILLTFIAKLVFYLQEYILFQSPCSGFSLQTNFILIIYFLWKIYQITLGLFDVYTFNNLSLLSSMFALTSINAIKIYTLFDYEILSVLSIFQQRNRKNLENNNNPLQISSNILAAVQKQPNQQMEQNKQQVQLPTIKQQTQNELRKDQIQSNQTGTVEKRVNDRKFYQSKKRLFVTVIASIIFIGQLSYTTIKVCLNDQNINNIVMWMGMTIARTTLLLMICQFHKVIQSYQKDFAGYLLIFCCDAILVVLSALIAYYRTYINLTSETSLFISLLPFVTIKMFHYADQMVHSKLDNSRYQAFFLYFLLPLGIRQILYIEGYSVVSEIIDILIYIFVVAVLVFWANKESFFTFWKHLKATLTAKKQKLKLFQKLKHTNFNYQVLVQTYIYFHVIIMSVSFEFSTSLLTTQLTITFFIIYFSPLVLYFLCLKNACDFEKQFPERYSPSKIGILIEISAIVYVIIAFCLLYDHKMYSLAVLLNISLFIFMMEGQNLAVIYLKNYQNFIKLVMITVFFIFIYLPFISSFISGYYLSSFLQNYLYYYSLFGFFYVWIIITVVGVTIHLVLNLTAKSKKDLFVVQYMQNQMRNINLKPNIEKILMISNMYELFNEKSEELLKYLKTEKHMTIVVRDQMEIEYDYEIVEPDDPLAKMKMEILAKPINPFDLIFMVKPNIRQSNETNHQQNQNPVFLYFKQKQKQKIQITKANDFNQNLPILKKMVERLQSINKDSKLIEKSHQFIEFQCAKNEQISELVGKIYYFLSYPSKFISRETFFHFLKLLTRQESSVQEVNKIYNRFSQCAMMNQYKFKNFLIDFVEYKYDMKGQSLRAINRTFCCRQLSPLLNANFEQFKYVMKRKKIILSNQSRDIWLNDKQNQEFFAEFALLKRKQAKKKARLLNHIKNQQTKFKQQANQEQQQQQQQIQYQATLAKQKNKRQSILNSLKAEQKQKKDKKFMKSQNIYSIIVNSLIQCYLYYEKEAENFKIKSIKFTLSNLLAIITKVADIVFVFGYSTIYLLIAYFNENFSQPAVILSNVPFIVLITLSSSLVLIYILLLIYHKKDFQAGTMGLDDNQRSLGFGNLKFYTVSILFVLGSGLANYILQISLNSYICNQTTDLLFNFSDTSCYSTSQYAYMLISLLILVIYWPLSSITFPFSTAMDRSLQIKYKSQFQIIYLQFKFLINGYNTLLNPFNYKQEQLFDSILKVIICCALAILYWRMQPCSYELMNMIEGKIYILLTILSFAGALCYFVGLLYSAIITGVLMLLFTIYFVYLTYKDYGKLKNENVGDEILEDNIKNQNIKIKILRENKITPDEVKQAEPAKDGGNDFLSALFYIAPSKQNKPRISNEPHLENSEIKLNSDHTNVFSQAINTKKSFFF